MLEEVYILTCAEEPELTFADYSEALIERDLRNIKDAEDKIWSIHTVKFVGQDYRQVYVCAGCNEYRAWCDGGTDSELCDKCWAESQRPWWLRWLKLFLPTGSHGCSECSHDYK